MPRSRWARALLTFTLVVAVLALLITATTSFERYAGTKTRPFWAEPCRLNEPRRDRELLADCARSTGFVAWVRGDPGREVHFALVGRFGVIIVKLGDPRPVNIPSVSDHVTVVGALVRAKNGMREIQAWRIRH